MENLITIQVTDAQLAALQCLAAESAEDANLLEQALAVPIPADDQSGGGRIGPPKASGVAGGGVRWASLPESLPPGGQIDTEPKVLRVIAAAGYSQTV